MTQHQLKAVQLSKSYNGREVVRDFTLSADSGQIIGLSVQMVPVKQPALYAHWFGTP